MLKEIIVSADEYETRAALLENKALAEIFIERKGETQILGNIYKGRVESILPGMQAAFVDIGLERNAFLHVSDITHHINEYGELIDVSEIETVELPSSDKSQRYSIRDLLKKGQEILVQIDKEPIGTKGPRVTAYITLPSRYLVYMPTVEHVGISRRIERDEERQRLKEIILRLRPYKHGFILRTAAEGKGEDEILNDINFLSGLWEQIRKRSQSVSAPALIHEDIDLTYRIIRDIFTEDITHLIVDSKEEHQKIMGYLENISPKLKSNVKLYDKREPIFEAFGIEKELKKALKPKIWLKSGGHIVIDQTEALVVIDVNTGKFVGKQDPDDTILKANLEAIDEIARQIRLRDLGGIIIIDFIDMDSLEHKQLVLKAINEALKRDRARTNVLQLTELGLVEMTRQRTKPGMKTLFSQPCPYCDGGSSILSEETVIIRLLRSIKSVIAKLGKKSLKIVTSIQIADRLLGEDHNKIQKLANEFGIKIEIKGDPDLHIEDYRFFSLPNNQEIPLGEI